MTKKNEVYKCALCGNIVEILHAGAGELVCCGQAMGLMSENTVDAAKEKHVPVITKVAEGYKVSVGSVAHPMEEALDRVHRTDCRRQGLSPESQSRPGPEATFCIQAENVSAREYCNLHGLWKA